MLYHAAIGENFNACRDHIDRDGHQKIMYHEIDKSPSELPKLRGVLHPSHDLMPTSRPQTIEITLALNN
jgi:hypothetical protein